MRSVLGLFALTIGASAVAPAPLAAQAAKKLPIADNSFLMEEAYNQEKGVMQHISLFQKIRDSDAWMYGFTQEWPVRGQRHQFSYTVPVSNNGSSSGLGDLMINWRLQTMGSEDSPTWISPRLSVILPTGDYENGMGNGGLGVQAALPISHRASEQLVMHTNVGLAFTPSGKAGNGASASMTTVNLGHSFIWQPRDRMNFMVEAVWAGTSTEVGSAKGWNPSFFISPGLRWGYDFASGLQIVPGVAFPIGVGPSKDEKQVLLYLSFEHPFTKNR